MTIPCHQFAFQAGTQNPEDDSFLGGRPKLPPDQTLPQCGLCGAGQSFFLQVALPANHELSGLSLAIFACTSCVDESHLIPEMLGGPLNGVEIPESFLTSYQTNFRFLIFDTAAAGIRDDYEERVIFRRIKTTPCQKVDVPDNKVGGSPSWLLEDETPGTYAHRTPLVFVLQLMSGFKFPIVAGAPRQMELALDGSPEPAERDYYELFNGNAIFLFATVDPSPLVYAITQVD